MAAAGHQTAADKGHSGEMVAGSQLAKGIEKQNAGRLVQGTGAAHDVQTKLTCEPNEFRAAFWVPWRQQQDQTGMVCHEGGKGRQQEFLLARMGGAADPDLAVRRQIEVISVQPGGGLLVRNRGRGIFQVAEDQQVLCRHPQVAHLGRIVFGLHGQQGKGGKERPEQKAETLIAGKGCPGDTAVDQHGRNAVTAQSVEPVGPEIRFHQDEQVRPQDADESVDDREQVQGRGQHQVRPGGELLLRHPHAGAGGDGDDDPGGGHPQAQAPDQGQGGGHLAHGQAVEPDPFSCRGFLLFFLPGVAGRIPAAARNAPGISACSMYQQGQQGRRTEEQSDLQKIIDEEHLRF